MTGLHAVSGFRAYWFGVLRCRAGRLAVMAAMWAAACGGDGGTEPEPPPQPNRPPVASGSLPAQNMTVGESVTVSVAAAFNDPDGDALTYTANSSNAGVVSVALSGTNVSITAVSAGTATVTVTARDPGGLSASASANVTVVEPNRPPAASGSLPAQNMTVGESVQVNVASFFTDPDGDPLTYAAASSNTAVANVSLSGSVLTVSAVAAGTVTVTVTASDPEGLSASLSASVTVESANRAPVTTGSVPAQTLTAGQSVQVNVASFFSDPDGDALTHAAVSLNVAIATASVAGSTVTVAGVAEGMATVTVTASDPGGLTASLSVSVTVTAGGGGGEYAPLSGLTITDSGGIRLGFISTNGCASISNITINGRRYTLHWSEWQRSTGSGWSQVPGTRRDGEACRYDLTTAPAGEYRLVAEISIDGVRGRYRSENTVTVGGGGNQAPVTVFRDDFDDTSSASNWTRSSHTVAQIADGMLQVRNDTTGLWAYVVHELDSPVTSWEVRARIGASADSMQTALAFAPTNPGELNFALYQLQIGHVVVGEETYNYRFRAFFTPEGRDRGWYFFGNLSGMSDAINDGAGQFTEIIVRVQDGTLEALAGGETLFERDVGETVFNSSLPEIGEVHFWSIDDAAANPGLLDWIEVNGVRTGGSSANADGEDRYRPEVPSDFTGDVGKAREASAVIVGEVPAKISLTPGHR